jgi:hypothetical protein
MEYSQKVLDVLHGTGDGATGAKAIAMGHWGNSNSNGNGAMFVRLINQSNGGDRSINLEWGTGAQELGHWGRSKRSNRSAMGQRQRSIVPIAINRVDVGGVGRGRGHFIPCFIRNASECQNGGANNPVTYSDVLV